MFKLITGALISISGIFGIIGSAIAMRFWLITVVIMSILKLTSVMTMAWFAGPLTAGAISTGLWMLFLGLIFMGISLAVTTIGVAVLDEE